MLAQSPGQGRVSMPVMPGRPSALSQAPSAVRPALRSPDDRQEFEARSKAAACFNVPRQFASWLACPYY